MTAPEPLGTVYRGWAPCTGHLGDEYRTMKRAELLPDGVTIDALIIELNDIGGGLVELAVDMWWLVKVSGSIIPDDGPLPDETFHTYIQADELDMGVVETYRIWARKYHETIGNAWRPRWGG